MEPKFHINTKTGEVGPCRAEKGGCPFGGEEVHFPSMIEAAAHYEGVMGGGSLNSTQKEDTGAVDLKRYSAISVQFPKGWKFDPTSLNPDQQAELSYYPKELQDLYFKMRGESPAVTHKDATSLTFAIKTMVERAPQRFASTLEYLEEHPEASTFNEFSREAATIPRSYIEATTVKELEETVFERLEKAKNAPRLYGFPEDEMISSNQYEAQRQLLEAASLLTGKTKQRLENIIYLKKPLDRPWKLEEEEELKYRYRHLKMMEKRTPRKAREMGEIGHELSIRHYKALGKEAFHKVAHQDGGFMLMPHTAAKVIGIPNRKTIDAMDEKSKKFWADFIEDNE